MPRTPSASHYTQLVATTAVERGLLIDGEWVETGDWLEVRSPYDGSLVGRVSKGGAAEARRAVDAAARAMAEPLPAHERAAILDTNVARVLFRIFVGAGDAKSHATRRHLWTLSETLMPARHVFDFNQALMDFGAMVCVARSPRCLICPMAKGCRSFPFNPEKAP